ncbi:hypothetical protein BJ996_000387 [Streptomyces phaeogriseichromatogenes]|nr:hypothetical protein [Streptomyces murinus]
MVKNSAVRSLPDVIAECAKSKEPGLPRREPSDDSMATYVPTSVVWSNAAVNRVAERPTTSPSPPPGPAAARSGRTP